MRIARTLLLVIIGVILVFMSQRGVILRLAGTETSAVVTEVTRYVKATDSYTVSYAFTDGSGKPETGSYIKPRVADTAALPEKGSTITVRYLSFLPGQSVLVGEPVLVWSDVMFLAVGIMLLVYGGIRGRRPRSGGAAKGGAAR